MTDTISPITEPHLTPMFATGAQPVAPRTEPHPAPIFDTGPHPDPLVPLGSEPVVLYAGEESAAAIIETSSDQLPAGETPSDETPSDGTSPDETPSAETPPAHAFSESENVDTDSFLRTVSGHVFPPPAPALPVLVPGSYLFVKRWKFALTVAGVWLVAAAAGLGFYQWWYTSLDKTLPVFGLLVYLVVAAVASILVSMVPNRPQVTALAVALMAAPLASTAAAAVLHGAYYFEWIARPAIG